MQLQQSYYDLSGPKSAPQNFKTHYVIRIQIMRALDYALCSDPKFLHADRLFIPPYVVYAGILTWAAPAGWQWGQLPPCALALATPAAPPL